MDDESCVKATEQFVPSGSNEFVTEGAEELSLDTSDQSPEPCWDRCRACARSARRAPFDNSIASLPLREPDLHPGF